MKISISYPPLESEKGTALLSQNRQFQWFNNPSFIYPMVPAYAATLLKEKGYHVVWDDAIAEKKSYSEWLDNLSCDLIAIETKTPVVKMHWKIIDEIKEKTNCKVVLMGDHVTAMPLESMENSKVDFVLTGGDYDFLLLNICEHLTKDKKLEPGIWYRDDGTRKIKNFSGVDKVQALPTIKNTGKFVLNHNLEELPLIDRELTKWQLYKVNGNFKRLPGTYTMVGRDCWYHKCKFCSWPTLYPEFRVRKPEQLVEEIGSLIENYGIREIMDDTGTFPVGEWLKRFCKEMIAKGYNKKVRIDCNMRCGVLSAEEYSLMAEAGFRLLLFGLESANQDTLDRIDKGVKVEQIMESCRLAKKAGLYPHLTTMIGYPWESKEDASKTIKLAKEIFSKGYADTLQATIVIPYPGTKLFDECKTNNCLLFEDWDRYDQREAVMKSPLTDEEVKELTSELYKVFWTPKYVSKKIISMRDMDDIKYAFRGVGKIFGHLTDFGGR
tara:strand:+ start:1876 stop:3360 length:1485 start_codon:yes stop_codon:yes gene_type:complete